MLFILPPLSPTPIKWSDMPDMVVKRRVQYYRKKYSFDTNKTFLRCIIADLWCVESFFLLFNDDDEKTKNLLRFSSS